MMFLLFLLVSYLVLCYGLSLLFSKAENSENLPEGLSISSKDAWIPGVNFSKWAQLVGRKSSYAFLLLIPLVNVFIYAALAVDLARSFGKFDFLDSFLAVVFGPFYFSWLGQQEPTYNGPVLVQEKEYNEAIALANKRGETRKVERLAQDSPFKRGPIREWTEAIIFAVSAAALIRLFVFEMFTIPTSSMEGSMLVGDYLLVSKAHYGIRTPKTVAMIPLLHNRLPFDMGESYFDWPSLKPYRFPALEAIDNNDPIVFNYPLGDSVYVMPGRTWSAEDFRFGNVWPQHASQIAKGNVELITRPLDKKDHYVKRAVGVAGDVVEIKNRNLFINNEAAIDPPNIQFRYKVLNPQNAVINFKKLYDLGVSPEDLGARTANEAQQILNNEGFYAVLNQKQLDALQAISASIEIEALIDIAPSKDTARKYLAPDVQARLAQRDEAEKYKLFPHDPANFPEWTKDNYGPITIPKKGMTVKIGPKNIALYRRIIDVYEEHELNTDGGLIKIDGEVRKEYTFEQDYYWAMGDNRHSSEDSRFWGFVPADHIVGKPLFIWFSTKEASMSNGIRWERIGMNATQMD